MSITYVVRRDAATPAIEKLVAKLGPGGLAAAVGPACARITRSHLRLLPDNKNRWPSTRFWNKAGDSVRWQAVAEGVLVRVLQTGVRQRYYGGPIVPQARRALTIPADGDAYGKTAAEFSDLKFSSVHGPNTFGSLIEPQTRRVVFWLSKGVLQWPDRHVLPTRRQMAGAAKGAISRAVK